MKKEGRFESQKKKRRVAGVSREYDVVSAELMVIVGIVFW